MDHEWEENKFVGKIRGFTRTQFKDRFQPEIPRKIINKKIIRDQGERERNEMMKMEGDYRYEDRYKEGERPKLKAESMESNQVRNATKIW